MLFPHSPAREALWQRGDEAHLAGRQGLRREGVLRQKGLEFRVSISRAGGVEEANSKVPEVCTWAPVALEQAGPTTVRVGRTIYGRNSWANEGTGPISLKRGEVGGLTADRRERCALFCALRCSREWQWDHP